MRISLFGRWGEPYFFDSPSPSTSVKAGEGVQNKYIKNEGREKKH